MLILVFITLSSCNEDVNFKYKFSTTNRISKESNINIYNYKDYVISNHKVEFNYLFNGCTYDSNHGIGLEENPEQLQQYKTDQFDRSDYRFEDAFLMFYVGYFRNLNEAIYFAETNLQDINNYIITHSHSNGKIDFNKYKEYDYRID